MLGVSLNEVLFLAAAIVAGGVVTGLLAGLFGVGGGAIVVPILYEVFRILHVPEDVRMQLCIGTSLAIIAPTTISSYLGHKARGAAATDVVRLWAIPAAAGVAIGSVLAAFAPSFVFKFAFMIIASLIATRLLSGRENWRLGNEFPGRPAMTFMGFLLGLCASLLGVSGGALSTFFFRMYGQPIHAAVATSAGVGVPITIVGAIGYAIAGWSHMAALPPLSIGFVSVIGVAVMAPVSSFAARFGVRLSHRLSRRHLEVFFGLFLLTASVRFFISLF